jgi:hypothetical protein
VRRVLPFLLLGGAVLLVLIGLGALGASYLLGRGNQADLANWKPPLEQIDRQNIKPASAVLELTSPTETAALDTALAQGDLDSAYALVAYSPALSDAQRVGNLLLLGSRYAGAKQANRAAWCYQYAAVLAVISPALSDLTRADTLVQTAQGLKGLNADTARLNLDQAYLIAQSSPTLRRDARARLFNQIAAGYTALGVSTLAQRARGKAAEVAASTTEEATGEPRKPFAVKPAKLPDSPELTAAINARIEAARALADELAANSPKTSKDLPADLVTALGDALFSEDQVRLAYYADQLKGNPDPGVEMAVWRARANWLALKWRVARGGYGATLVGDWESDPKTIRADLDEAFGQIFVLVEDQATALPEADAGTLALQDVLSEELVAVRWGWYTNVDEAEIRGRITETIQKLQEASVPGLRLDTLTRGGKIVYLLVPDELYQQGEKALPR